MGLKDFSPEERLLRLIRSKTSKQQQPLSVSKGQEIKEEVKKEPISAPARPDAKKEIKILRWEYINLALIILLIGLILYFIPFFFKSPKGTIETLEEKFKAQEQAAAKKAEEPPKRPPFDYFSENVGARNIFSPAVKEETPAAGTIEEGPKLEDVKRELTLLGVIGGEIPQAIIEDKRVQKTYFLNKGSTFDDIEVGDILENKVILIYKGKQFELVL